MYYFRYYLENFLEEIRKYTKILYHYCGVPERHILKTNEGHKVYTNLLRTYVWMGR
jgi:hypothetical protein